MLITKCLLSSSLTNEDVKAIASTINSDSTIIGALYFMAAILQSSNLYMRIILISCYYAGKMLKCFFAAIISCFYAGIIGTAYLRYLEHAYTFRLVL